jgi:hypothetical protein
MKNAKRPVLALMLLAACTTPSPNPSPNPIIERRFVGSAPVERDSSTEFWRALEAHGVDCSGFEGSIWGSGKDAVKQWQTSCSGTEQEWKKAEPAIARLTAEGIVEELIDRYFAITDRSKAVETERVFQSHGMTCQLDTNSVKDGLLREIDPSM